MERLNEIMGRASQRRQLSDHRAPQNQGPQGARTVPAQPPMNTRRPMPEQTARLGQRKAYGAQQPAAYQPAPRPRPMQRQDDDPAAESRSYTTRPLYPRQRAAAPQNAYQAEAAYQRPPVPPRQGASFPRTDDYLPPPVQADVVEEWDDEGGMVYGDWEEGGEPLIYQRGGVEVVPERNAVRSYYAELPEAEKKEYGNVTRDLRELRMPVAAQLPQPVPVRSKEMPRYQRMTQPLNPQALVGLNREREVLPEGRAARQLVPQEHMPPARTKAVLPMSQKAVCTKCKGAGFLRADVPYGHPNFGKPVPCVCKENERKEKRRQQLRAMSNLDAFRDNNFQTFNPRVPGVQEAYRECINYAQNPDGWLLLVGPNGCGKTHLAVAIANQCLESGSVVLFAVVPDLLDHLRAAFAPDAPEMYDQLFAKMREAEVLVLDDLGTQQSSPWANEKLFQLLNYRYNLGMPTVITANPKGLQGIDERIRSRLSDNSLVLQLNFNHARDYRPNHPRHD